MLEKQVKQKFSNEKSDYISLDLVDFFKHRRSTRNFSSEPIDINLVKRAIEIAGSAPSGANKQPWSFVLVTNENLKYKIRQWAEQQETGFYHSEKPALNKWREDLAPLHTNNQKDFLTDAFCLILVFMKPYEFDKNHQKKQNYYAKESIGIATGFLISALHLFGLSSLTYTPTNRKNLSKFLGRDEKESTYMILPVGLPSENAKVPKVQKKTLEEILKIY